MAIEPPNSVSREKDAKPQRKTPKRINLLGVVLVEAAGIEPASESPRQAVLHV